MPVSHIRADTAPSAVVAVARQIGANIAAARKRRRWREQDLAARAGITRTTLRHVEAGKLGTGIGAYLAMLWALGLEKDARYLASVDVDSLGKVLTESRLGARMRRERIASDF